jgi:hypothetical protein
MMRMSVLSAVAWTLALVWSMLVWELQLAITNPRRMENGSDTRRIPATRRTE